MSFKRILLNKCQEEFEKNNVLEEVQKSFADVDTAKMTPHELDEHKENMNMARIKAKKRMLGNINEISTILNFTFQNHQNTTRISIIIECLPPCHTDFCA